jgi:hypothetical protein
MEEGSVNNKTRSGMKCILYLFGLLALPVQAASFDCAKAGTKIEKLICADAELSKLDEELNAAYKTVLQDEKRADSIRQAQKQWMKERNACSEAACVKRVYEVRLHGLLLPASARTPSINIPQQFLHRWTGYSKVIYSIYGNLNVSSHELIFEKKGKHSFAVISTFEDSVVFKMAETFQDCGRYVRLGPVIVNKSSDSLSSFAGDMNFSVYTTKEAALAPMQFDKGQRSGESCTWGLYSRTESDETP